MTPHIEANHGDYAEDVLLPGDPMRAEWIADTFLDNVKVVNRVRGATGLTGTYQGRRVSVQATGMGMPSAAIYVNELLMEYGVKRLIRVGTCGGLNAENKVRDIVLAQAASTNSNQNQTLFGQFQYASIADFGLLRKAVDTAELAGLRTVVGGLVTDDNFYDPLGGTPYEVLKKHGTLAVEMETAALYTIAARYGVKALTIATISDCLVTHEELSPEARQASLVEMVKLALDTLG
jgi:purine-nucleoside phosphorylase